MTSGHVNNSDVDIENSVCSTEPTTSGSVSTGSSNEDTNEAKSFTKTSPSRKKKIIKKTKKTSATTEKREEDCEDVNDDNSDGDIGRRRFIITSVIVVVHVCIAIGLGVHFVKGGKEGSGHAEVTLTAVQYGPFAGGDGESYYPNPTTMVPCAQDESCQIIMEGLGPVIPPGTMAVFSMTDTCQSRVRDWLRSSSADLKYDTERIRQRFALGVIYCELDGHLWLENQMWLSDVHECDWYNRLPSDRKGEYDTSSYSIVNRTGSYPFKLHPLYDTCNTEGQLEVLILDRNHLQGTLPSELSMLTELKILDLSHNFLSGTIPYDLSALSKLQYVDLSHNMFSVINDNMDVDWSYRNPVPELFFRFPKVKYLDLSSNNFDGEIPNDTPVRMQNLQHLNLQNNRFNGTIPETFKELKYHLTTINLSNNLLEGPIDPILDLLVDNNDSSQNINAGRHLQEIYLHGNNLNGTISFGVTVDLTPEFALRNLTLHSNPELHGSIGVNVCTEQSRPIISVDCTQIICACCICRA